LIPYAAGFFFAINPAAGGRYFLFPSIFILFISSAKALSHALKIRKFKIIVIPIVVLMIGFHFFWSSSHLWNHGLFHSMTPVRAYFGGIDGTYEFSNTPDAKYLDITGQECVPKMFGGPDTLEKCGALVMVKSYVILDKDKSFLRLLKYKFIFILLLLFLLIINSKNRPPKFLQAGIILFIGLSLISSNLHSKVLNVQNSKSHIFGTDMEYEVEMSKKAVHALENEIKIGNRIALRVGNISPPNNLKLQVGEYSADLVRGGPLLFIADPKQFLSEIKKYRKIIYKIAWDKNHRDYLGWQKIGLPKRSLSFYKNGQRISVSNKKLPSIELWAISKKTNTVTLSLF